MVKHQLWSSIRRGVFAKQRPCVGLDVIAVKVTFEGLAVSDAGVQVASECVDLASLGVDAHLVA